MAGIDMEPRRIDDAGRALRQLRGNLQGIGLALQIPNLNGENIQNALRGITERQIMVIDIIISIDERLTVLEGLVAPATEDLDGPDPWDTTGGT